ncbi:unnamed protein product, partial [Linum tenue]
RRRRTHPFVQDRSFPRRGSTPAHLGLKPFEASTKETPPLCSSHFAMDLVEALMQDLVEALLLPMFWSRVLLCHKWKKTMSTTILMRMMRLM